ncbi:UDP-glucuronosyltransferase [Aphelenchoides bicaudatus]|nr:UDP-glucuronosyltransferase [Aphelenchoides bicaudatus]
MKFCLPCLILANFISFVDGRRTTIGKNVLIIAPLDTGTHLASMSIFAVALSNAGHNVSIFEWSYKKEPRNLGPNVTTYHIQEKGLDAKILEKRAINTFVGSYNGVEYIELLPKFNAVTRSYVEEHSDLFRLISLTKWDLVVVDEIFTYHGLGIAAFLRKHYNVPYAIYSTTQMMSHTASSLGLGRNLVARPYWVTREAEDEHDLYDVKNFFHRLFNVYNSGSEFVGNILLSKRFFGSNNYLIGIDSFNFEKFFRGSSLTIADYYTRWKYPIPENSRLKSMASACKKVDKLPSDLKQFVEDPNSLGTIYIAFGTAVFWQHAPPKMLNAFFEAFEHLKEYRIIFAYSGAPRNVSSHVQLIKWAPQLEILSHPKTKVYLTHGGLKSSKEAACAGIPVVYMPLYAEQTFNAHMATSMGFALPLNKHTITAHKLEKTIRRVATESHFKENIIRARSLSLDRPISAVNEMIFYVGRVLKARNGEFDFRNKAGHLNWFEFLYGEAVVLLSILLFVVASK